MQILKPLLDAHAQVKAQRTPEDCDALEKKKLFRLQYIQEIAKTAVIVTKAFMNAILSLVSGIIAAVSGVFQVRKMVLTGKKEIKELKIEVGTLMPSKAESVDRVKINTGSGSTVSMSPGYAGPKVRHRVATKAKPTATATAVPQAVIIPKVTGFEFDTGTLTFILSLALFVVLRFIGKTPKSAETPRS